MTEIEKQIVGIISASGQSKAKSFEALRKLRSKDFDAARKLIKEATESDLEAHKIQTALISAEMSDTEKKPEMSLLMVHAQDHYMTSQLARDLIEEMINVFEEMEVK